MSSIEQFHENLVLKCPGITLHLVTQCEIENFDMLLPKKLAPFKGTLKVHEVTWEKTSNKLQARELTCISCHSSLKCPHYGMGEINILLEENQPSTSSHEIIREDEDHPEKDKVRPHSTRISGLIYSKVYGSYSESGSDEAEETKQKFRPININDYIIVNVFGKKSIKKYVANVVEKISLDEFKVKFMCRCTDTKNKFVFSNEPEAIVLMDDIVQILRQPLLNSRLQYSFKEIGNSISF